MSASCKLEALPQVVVLIFLPTDTLLEVYMIKGYKTIQQKAEEWNITSRRIQILCNQERIAGAEKIGKIWLIPEEAEKPSDMRKK